MVDTKKLNNMLELLRSELDSLDESDIQAREKLLAIAAEIEARLANPDSDKSHESLIETIRDSISWFEVTHPRATGILNQFMVTLANMGI